MVIVQSILIFSAAIYCFSVFYLIIGLFRLKSEKSKTINSFSVIIAAHNEEQNLNECLQCLVSQDYPKDKYEVIIADDRSTDNTPEIIKHYCEQYPNFRSVCVNIDETAVPKKTALIRALDIANGEIILSTDGDCIQSPKWISSMNDCFTEGVGMVIGHVGYFKPKNMWQGIDALDYLTHRAMGAAFIGIKSVYTCTAANMAYKKDIFIKNRDAFTKLKIRPAEDNFILHCTRNLGYQISIALEPESIVETSGASTFSHFMNQRFRWAAYGGNITSLGVKLFFIPALFFYSMIWVALFSSILSPKILPILGYSCLAKAIFDFVLMMKYLHIYHLGYMIRYFIPLSLFHLILAPLVAIKGNLFSFKWKNKRYTKDIELSESALL